MTLDELKERLDGVLGHYGCRCSGSIQSFDLLYRHAVETEDRLASLERYIEQLQAKARGE